MRVETLEQLARLVSSIATILHDEITWQRGARERARAQLEELAKLEKEENIAYSKRP